MRYGVALPQAGNAASAEAITRAAVLAEEVGFEHVWVGDYVVHPKGQPFPPSPLMVDAFVALTWAAAATERVGLGTCALVLPRHNPVWVANALASLDALSGGRVLLGATVGWSKAEFDALGYRFEDRGARADEALRFLRSAWRDDPPSFDGESIVVSDVHLLPKPAHDIPIWIGGNSEAAFRRAVELGDGFQAALVTPDQAAVIVRRLRRDRPGPGFTMSARVFWDPQVARSDNIRAERDAFAAAGVEYAIVTPLQDTADGWLKSMELVARDLDLDLC